MFESKFFLVAAIITALAMAAMAVFQALEIFGSLLDEMEALTGQ